MARHHSLALATATVAAVLTSVPAMAVEVQFEGFYRARGRAFSSLSIDPDLTDAAPPSAWIQHRLWLAPRFVVSDKVAVYTEFRGLDGVTWGQAPFAEDDPLATPADTERQLDLIFTDDLRAPTTLPTDGLPRTGLGFELWRTYAEIHGKAGTFRFGRMPIHWGLGVWQNDGMGLSADYGDSADRVQWERAFDKVFVRGALEVDSYGLASREARDIYGGTIAAAYRDERLEIGLNTQVKRATGGQTASGSDQDPFTLVTASAALDYEVGDIRVGAEIVGRFGTGQLGERTSATVASAGGVIVAEATLGKPVINVDLGVATGDGNENDDNLNTFTFDRDYNIGILLFEQPMPVFASSSGRDASQAISGNGISNAIFGRAAARYPLPEDLELEAAVAGARAFQRPEGLGDQVWYGVEANIGLRWQPDEDVDIVGTGAFMLPGSYYSNYNDGDTLTDGLDGFVIGGQLLGRVRF